MSASAVALPFRTLGADDVVAAPWTVTGGERAGMQAPAHLPGWDYRMSVRAQRTVHLNPEAARRSVGAGRGVPPITLIVTLGTGTGILPRHRKVLVRRTLPCGTAMPIDILVPPGTTSGRIWLRTDLVLGSHWSDGDGLSPSQPGQRLWQDTLDVDIERSSLHFPTEAVSFERMFAGRPHAAAPWYLLWIDPDPEQDLRGAVRLYLNTDHEDFVKRAIELDVLSLQAMMADVMVQVTGCVLRADDLDGPAPDRPPGSLGRQAIDWLELAFPGEATSSVAQLMRARPGDFHAALVAAAAVSAETRE